MNEQVYNYIYDQIGNRVRSDLGKWTRQFAYTANNVNQYTQRTVPDEFPFYGTASTSATVLVNNVLASRYGMYYSSVLAATNSAMADYKKVVVEAAATNSYTATTGRVFVAKTPEVFTYDADGNMTSDGRFTYEWNAENRLGKVRTLSSGLPTNVPVMRLVLNYDHQGRRISMVRSKYEGGAWVWQENRKFIYDGWNLVGETRNANSVTVTNWYVWGLDLSGTLQGAGGVGGLLNASFGGATPLANYIAYDGNGNVTDLIGGNGAKRAHYEYDPFGNATTETGTLAASNPFRFSTKYWDEDTKLLSYQLRDYCPGTGRWASRDPIGEISPNIYMFCGNSLNQIDVYGLMSERELGILLAWWYFYGNGELFTYGSDVLKKQVNVYQPTQIWLREFGDRVCKRLLQNKKYGEETGIISSLLNGIKADNSDWLLHTINGAEEFRVNGTYTAIACSHCYIEFDLKYAFVDKADMHWNRWPDRWLIIWRFLPHPLPRGEEYSIRIEWNGKSSFVTPGSPSYSGWPFVINE